MGKRIWQSSFLVSSTKTLSEDLAQIADNIELVDVPREGVEIGNDAGEERSQGTFEPQLSKQPRKTCVKS